MLLRFKSSEKCILLQSTKIRNIVDFYVSYGLFKLQKKKKKKKKISEILVIKFRIKASNYVYEVN